MKNALKIGFWIALCVGARADSFTIELDHFSRSGRPGTLVTFSGKVSNLSGGEVFLNGAGGTTGYPELTVDVTPFLTFAPLSLQDGESYSGELFTVAVSGVALPGSYGGVFVVQGGDAASYEVLGSQGFRVEVGEAATAPEPGAMGLFVAIGGVLAWTNWRRRRGRVA